MSRYVVLNNFKSRLSKICYMGILNDILQFHGIQTKESSLLGLSAGWLFRFGFSNTQTLFSPIYMTTQDLCVVDDGVYDQNILYTVLKKHYGLIAKEVECKNISSAWDTIRYELENCRIPMVSIFLSDLPYLPKALQTKDGHYIALYGYDLRQDKLYMADSLVLTKPRKIFQGDIPLQSFLQALQHRIDQDGCVRLFQYEKSEEFKQPDINDHLHSISTIIEANKYNQISCLFGGSINAGAKAYNEFINSIHNIIELFNDSGAKNNLNKLYAGITSHSGPVVCRSLLQEYFDENCLKNHANYKPLKTMLSQLTLQWDILSKLCVRASMFPETASLQKIENQIAFIADMERKAIELLYHISFEQTAE